MEQSWAIPKGGELAPSLNLGPRHVYPWNYSHQCLSISCPPHYLNFCLSTKKAPVCLQTSTSFFQSSVIIKIIQISVRIIMAVKTPTCPVIPLATLSGLPLVCVLLFTIFTSFLYTSGATVLNDTNSCRRNQAHSSHPSCTADFALSTLAKGV